MPDPTIPSRLDRVSALLGGATGLLAALSAFLQTVRTLLREAVGRSDDAAATHDALKERLAGIDRRLSDLE